MTEAERLLEAVMKKSEPRLRAIRKRIENGTATFADTAEYSRILSELLGRELSAEVLGLDDREGTAEALLRESYNDTNEVCAQVQTALDEKNGLHLAPQKAPFPAERVAQFAHSLVDPTVPDEKIQRRAKSGTENISMSFHDDFIEQNAEFRERAGLKCYVTRTSSGSCCPWCTAVAGKYLMSEQPEGLFRRHDNCDCVIVYDGQVLRGQKGENGRRNKKWVENKAARIEFAESVPKPVVNSPEQAKELEKQLTSGGESAIIEEKSKYYTQAVDYLNALGIERVETTKFEETPSESEIIQRLGGGDKTKGSCTSLAFAYAGNKAGINVLDFRGGKSCEYFSKTSNINDIIHFSGVNAKIEKNTNDFQAVSKLLQSVEANKEYVLVTGKHTAVIRKTENNFEFLELQDPTSNGFKPLTAKKLKSRFACKASHKTYGYDLQASSFLIDCDSLERSEEFIDLLSYLNTNDIKQLKGVGGNVK